MMTPDERRAHLRRLLNALPMDRDAYLHEGRAMTRPPVDDLVEKIEALFADDTPSLFQDAMQASKTFVERFPGGHLTEDGTLTKFLEESEEFYEAATDYSPYRNAYDAHVHRQKMTGEAFDVMVTMGGVLSFFGVSADEIEQAMRAGLDKLNSRTTENYAWYDSIKQVAKKSKMESAS
jgi:fructose/tagatose bisphosphate aldolase